jgi:hypothetical protein
MADEHIPPPVAQALQGLAELLAKVVANTDAMSAELIATQAAVTRLDAEAHLHTTVIAGLTAVLTPEQRCRVAGMVRTAALTYQPPAFAKRTAESTDSAHQMVEAAASVLIAILHAE